MTMDFKRPPRGLPRGLAVGDDVSFEFYMDADSQPQLSSIAPVAPPPKKPAAVGSQK
jgi:Cu(I)/Ag(I) efflux system membrane fusion protein